MSADFITEDMKLSVKHGAVWLDENHPNWAQKINLSELVMDSCVDCIVGQAIGHYYDLFKDEQIDNEWASDHGFVVQTVDDEHDTDPDYRKLETLWTEEVNRRLS